MKVKPKAAQTDLPPVIKIAEATAMKQPERVQLFASKDAGKNRLFIELGKLFGAIRRGCGPGQTPFGLLLAVGVKKGSISNASQTDRVIEELVTPGLVPEDVFNTFHWADITAINQCMSGKSVKKLAAPEVADLIKLKPDTFDSELESIFETGNTVAEVEAIAAKAVTDAAKLKADTEKAAADAEKGKVDAEKAAKVATEALERLEKKTGQTAPPAPAAPVGTGTPVVSVPGKPAAPVAGTVPAATPTPAAQAPGKPADGKIVQIPASPDAAVPETLHALDVIAKTAHGFTAAGKKTTLDKLREVMDGLLAALSAKDQAAWKKAA
jgi:hypothetical protein